MTQWISRGILFFLYLTTASAATIQTNADNLINKIGPKMNIGAYVVDLNTGETLYARNASRSFIPASNMKLFSDAAALLILGPDYRFKNQLSTDAPHLEKGVLHGSVYLHLPGDPSFTSKQLKSLLSELQTWGATTIQGDFIIVSSHAQVDPYPPGWVPHDFRYSYGASTSPVMLDENRMSVTVNPAAKPGALALVELSNDGFILENYVNTTEKPTGCGLDYQMTADSHLIVKGCVGVGQWANQQGLAIRNPLSYMRSQIHLKLKQLGIDLQGDIKLGQAPKNTLLIATQSSKPISQLLADTLKPSDNLYADSLYLQAANKLNGAPLNWAESQPVIKNFLHQQTGVNFDDAVLIDGSGLSRNDRISPIQTVGLLKFLHARFPLAYEYIAALPIAGQDGTLQKRLNKPTQQGFVRAKTGSMTGVASLSGYLYTANAHTLAFAIYINRQPKVNPSVSGRYLADALCDFFLNQKPADNRVISQTNAHSRVSFQQRPTQAETRRNMQSKWRHVEYALKQAFKGKPIAVLFRGDQLILNDDAHDPNAVWTTLQNLNKKYQFSVVVKGLSGPSGQPETPALLWIKTTNEPLKTGRIWTIRESTG